MVSHSDTECPADCKASHCHNRCYADKVAHWNMQCSASQVMSVVICCSTCWSITWTTGWRSGNTMWRRSKGSVIGTRFVSSGCCRRLTLVISKSWLKISLANSRTWLQVYDCVSCIMPWSTVPWCLPYMHLSQTVIFSDTCVYTQRDCCLISRCMTLTCSLFWLRWETSRCVLIKGRVSVSYMLLRVWASALVGQSK